MLRYRTPKGMVVAQWQRKLKKNQKAAERVVRKKRKLRPRRRRLAVD